METLKALRQRTVEIVKSRYGFSDLWSKDLEIGVFNATIQYCTDRGIPVYASEAHFLCVYKNRARSCVFNMDANPEIVDKVRAGVHKPHDIAFMNHESLRPEVWVDLHAAKTKREENMMNNQQVSMTDQYRCGRCKKNQCSYYQLQVRSADEGITTFLTCLNCSHKWRIN